MDQTVPMTDEGQSTTLTLLLRQIDILVDAGRTTVIESLMKTSPLLRTDMDLLLECIAAEFRARQKHGQAPLVDEYRQRFPQQADRLNAMFGVVGPIRVGEPQVNSRGSSDSAPQTPLPAAPPKSHPAPTVKDSLQTSQAKSTHPGPLMESGVLPASKFGRYVIERVLGKGAMGIVYLVEDTQFRRKVALKVPTQGSLEQPDTLDRFYVEAHSAAALHHTNICPVYDWGEIDGIHYLTMRYLPGTPLNQLLEEGYRFSARDIAELTRKIASALETAHRAGIVHRDLKPANVMMDADHEPIVMDFGLACQFDAPADNRLTVNGAILGTPAYMSPEQALGKLEEIGPLTDVYSLGAVLYHLLTGQPPYVGSPQGTLAQILAKDIDPVPPTDRRPDADPVLSAMCLKMISKKSALRYSSMAAVVTALSEHLNQGTSAPVAGDKTTVSSTPVTVVDQEVAALPARRLAADKESSTRKLAKSSRWDRRRKPQPTSEDFLATLWQRFCWLGLTLLAAWLLYRMLWP